jgi:hypothetical protein
VRREYKSKVAQKAPIKDSQEETHPKCKNNQKWPKNTKRLATILGTLYVDVDMYRKGK